MKAFDILLSLLIPTLILVHLLVAPYTKVEESFNIQATHDIINYKLTSGNSTALHLFDHVSFPGSVPRTFVGAVVLATISKPIIGLTKPENAQFIVRAVLGLLNAFALLRYKGGLEKVYGRSVGRWYILLQAAQFHVIYYASRTLPNMFAFALTTLALREFLPAPFPVDGVREQKRQRLGIILFIFAGVVFRSEVALLLFIQLACMVIQPRISLDTIVPAGLRGAILALAISIPIDSYFWKQPIWPELVGFYYNAIQGKSSDWGTSPYSYYFSSLLPRLLLNPLIMILLIPLSLALPTTRYKSRDLIIPSVLFIATYSLQPHKESRFIIYVVPPLTAAASLSASYIWTRRTKNVLYALGSLLLIGSILASFAASTVMLLISSLNYPGGEAISQVRSIIAQTKWPETNQDREQVRVHMDVLSCMTGVTRFQEIPFRHAELPQLPIINSRPTQVLYDKEEDAETLLQPEFWNQFDYALMEEPGKAIGKWEVVSTIYSYAGIEFLRPGDGSSFGENMERVYKANNLTKEDGVLDSEDVKEAVEENIDLETWGSDRDLNGEAERFGDLHVRLLFEEMSRFGTYKLVRDVVRSWTGGYWIGPRVKPAIRILKRVKDPLER